MKYKPDRWLIVLMTGKDGDNILKTYKIFGTWAGGYTTGDSWKLSSGFEPYTSFCSFDREANEFDVQNYSGSVYRLKNAEHCYGTTMYTASVLANFAEQIKNLGDESSIEVLEYEAAVKMLSKA